LKGPGAATFALLTIVSSPAFSQHRTEDISGSTAPAATFELEKLERPGEIRPGLIFQLRPTESFLPGVSLGNPLVPRSHAGLVDLDRSRRAQTSTAAQATGSKRPGVRATLIGAGIGALAGSYMYVKYRCEAIRESGTLTLAPCHSPASVWAAYPFQLYDLDWGFRQQLAALSMYWAGITLISIGIWP
jgi:hypothetical protein